MVLRQKSSSFEVLLKNQIAMKRDKITTLIVKIHGTIELPPAKSREEFRHGVIETVLEMIKTEDVSIEYIGYEPAQVGTHYLNDTASEYEDCVYASFHVNNTAVNQFDLTVNKHDLISTFVKVFEDKTNRHLEVDSTLVRKGKQQRIIEMSSNWKFYRKHA